jgi:chromosome partitioning protein
MIITVGSTKGGVGKSTISCNLAVLAALKGKSVLLVDADTQGSSMSFRASRETDDIQAIQITTPTIHKDLNQFNHDLKIVDAGGRDNKAFRSAIMAADLLIIPCLPSSVDFWAASDVIEILEEARTFKDIPAHFVLNQVIPNTRLSVEIVEAMKEFEKNAGLLKAVLCSRIVYKNAFAEGKGVVEMTDKKAAEEVKNLYNEISNLTKE